MEQTQETTEPTAVSFEEAAKTVFGEPKPVKEAPVVAAEPVVDEPKPEPAAEDTKVAQRIATAKRAEIRAAEARVEQRERELALDAREKALAAREAEMNLLDEDPVKFFEVKKKDPKDFLEKLAGEYKPESVQSKKIDALEKELAAIREERTKEQEIAKRQELRRQTDAAWEEASKGFVAHVEASAEKFPHLVAEYTEGEAVAAAERALLEIVGHDDKGKPVTRAEAYRLEFGDYPDNDVIAEYLDGQAKARSEARQNSAWRKQATTASEATPSGDLSPKAPPVNRGSSPRTLTSRAASEKAAPPKQWTQQAADEESLRILERAFKG